MTQIMTAEQPQEVIHSKREELREEVREKREERVPVPVPSSRVILTIFAGRRQFLEILRHYLLILLDLNYLHEIHLWDFTRDEVDKRYLSLLSQSDSRYHLLGKTKDLLNEDNRLQRWLSFYSYYINETTLNDEDILIKCDDDIVYLDIQSFQSYIDTIRSHSLICNLFFPNIVNNDVCAYLQTQYSIHNLLPLHEISPKFLSYGNPNPLTGIIQRVSWFLNSQKAIDIHQDFLTNSSKYHSIHKPRYIPWYSRISINFFGSLGRNIRHAFRLLVENSNDDEEYLTSHLIRQTEYPNCIIPTFVVNHYSFHGQRNDYLEYKLREILPLYYQHLQQTLTQFINSPSPPLPSGSLLLDVGSDEIRKQQNYFEMKRNLLNLSFYQMTYSPLLLIDDPMEEEKEQWSEELEKTFLTGFRVNPNEIHEDRECGVVSE